MSKFNGEIKEYREAAEALKAFEAANADFLKQYKEIEKAAKKAEDAVKDVAKAIAIEKNEEIKDTINGVVINAYFVDKKVFDLSKKDLTELYNLGILEVAVGKYDKAVEEGKLTAFHTKEFSHAAAKVKLEE